MSADSVVGLSAPPGLAETAVCRHFGSCGGCGSQGLSYQEELRVKQEALRAVFAPLGAAPDRVHPSPETWFYRNKMDFSFGLGSPEPLLGLKAKRQWSRVLNIQECFLLSPEAPRLLEAVGRWAASENLAPYDPRSHSGFLRNLVLREAKNSGDRMAILVTRPGAFSEDSFVQAVRNAYPATTILRGTTDSPSDGAAPEGIEVLFGPGTISEALDIPGRALRFRISPLSFFQSNTRAAEKLHVFLRNCVRNSSPKLLLDLYCGLGAIAISLADLCGEVVGLECAPSSAGQAQANAWLNGVFNASFYEGPAEILLPALLAMSPDCVVLDPPRSGLHPRVLKALLGARVPALLYVSCNPKTLLRDLTELSAAYRVEKFEAFDFFPHTDHVEAAAMLRAR